MYDATKNIIITGLLFDELVRRACQSKNIQITHPEENHVVFTHTLADLGDQALLFSEIENDLVLVTFVGAQEYLERLEINGWLETADDLAKYFAELGEDFQPVVARVSKLQIGPHYTLLILDNQPIDIQLANDVLVAHDKGASEKQPEKEEVDSLEEVLTGAAAEVVELLDTARDEVVEVLGATSEVAHDVADATAEAVSEAASATVEKADEVAAKVDGKFRRVFRHPATKYVAGVVLIGAGVALWRIVRAKAESIVPELADVEL